MKNDFKYFIRVGMILKKGSVADIPPYTQIYFNFKYYTNKAKCLFHFSQFYMEFRINCLLALIR